MLFYIITPIVSSILGWLLCYFLSNYIQKKYLPQLAAQLARDAGEKTETYLLTQVDIEKRLADPTLVDKAMPILETHINEFLNEKLPKQIPMLAMLITTKTTEKVKEVFVHELKTLFPVFITQIAQNAKNDKDFGASINRKMVELTSNKLLSPFVGHEIRKIRIWGFIVGLIIGCVNVLIGYLFHI